MISRASCHCAGELVEIHVPTLTSQPSLTAAARALPKRALDEEAEASSANFYCVYHEADSSNSNFCRSPSREDDGSSWPGQHRHSTAIAAILLVCSGLRSGGASKKMWRTSEEELIMQKEEKTLVQ